MPSSILTADGSIIPGVITNTLHAWTADDDGTFHTTANLQREWSGYYATMLAGHGDTLTAVQRMEGNSEAVMRFTGAANLTAARQAAFRETLQREYDAIDAAMRTNQVKYGIDPTRQFNAYTYLKLEQTLQADAALKELGTQGHGVNAAPAERYEGFTTDFQNRVDGATFYVGGGPGQGENAIATFLDDDLLTHAPFPVVLHNGVLTQLNQNGNLEDPLTDVLAAANANAYTRVLVASDFSTDERAVGAVVLVPGAKPAPAMPVAPAGSIVTYDGSVISGTITVTLHGWTADATGTFHTSADLAAEWGRYFTAMQAGHGDQLTAVQRLEGNSEAVLRFTAGARMTVARQASFRETLQREYDAIDAAMRTNATRYGIDASREFNTYTYLKMEETLQGDETLKELATQGHGVNAPPSVRYSGFTNDFQNKVDGKTFYVGGGPGSGELAIANFLDDDLLTHAPFAVVMHNGVLTQLNQNGNLEDSLAKVVTAANQNAYERVLVAADFSTDKTAAGAVVLVPGVKAAPPVPSVPLPTTVATWDGSVIAATITVTLHGWQADATGTFHTAADLKAEWGGYYAQMLAGHGDGLTAVQRLEGNAEAVMRFTAASRLSDGRQAAFRETLQREFDAIDAAMRTNQVKYGIDPTRQFNAYTYLKMEQTLQADETLKELGYQGHGVNGAPLGRYEGFTEQFQNTVDSATFYVGGGPGNGQKAIANFLDDDLLTHAPFPVVLHNGVLTQLNQNGNLEDPLTDVLLAANQNAYTRVLVASDFSLDGMATGEVVLVPGAKAAPELPVAPRGSLLTYDGSVIPGVITATLHQWVADADGTFHTSADLKAEWGGAYAAMLAGQGAGLTAVQRMEGNAEAVLRYTAASKLTAVKQASFRETLQREFDAIDAAMRVNQSTYGIDPALQFNAYTYLKLEQTLQADETLKELATQGHGVNAPPAVRYRGFTNDFQNRVDGKTFYVGGGPGNGENAIANFLDDDLLTHAPFPVVMHNGVLTQLNQNGNLEDSLTEVLAAANQNAYTRVLVAGDFSLDKSAAGPVMLVAGTRLAPGQVQAAAGLDVTLDPASYLRAHPEVSADGADPAEQYHETGWKQGWNPNAWFDTDYYLAQNPDVKAAGIDPLQHFEAYGWKEGRDPSLAFSGAKYLAAYGDVKAAGMDPLQHYLAYGANEGRMAFLTGGAAAADALVDAGYYDRQLGATIVPTGLAGARQAAWSYDTGGWQKGLNPDAWFDTQYYLSHNADVAAAHIDPLLHYEAYGWKEGRDPSAVFSTAKYLAANADVKAAGMNPLLHYVEYGQNEGRAIFSA